MEHSFAKVWLDRLGNKIYINNKDFFSHNLEKAKKKFKIEYLSNHIELGNDLVDSNELAEITTISFGEMKKKFGLTVYKIRAEGKLGWRKAQRYILIISKKKSGIPDELPETTLSRRGVVLEWDKLNQCIRGVGEDFGTIKGQYRNGDITPWYHYGDKKKGHNLNYLVKRQNYSEISDDLFNRWLGKESDKVNILKIKEIPIMITEEGELLCLPKTRVLPRLLIVGKSGKGKCTTKGSKVLMADGKWKNIEDVKIGDEVVSPQRYGPSLISNVVDTCSYFSEDNYDVISRKEKKPLYTCTGDHRIPMYNKEKNRIIDLPVNEAKDIAKVFSVMVDWNMKFSKRRILFEKSEPEQVYGITLDSPSQYYITNDMMVTHNSWSLNSILGRVVYNFQDRAGLLNDSLNQFYDLSLPMAQQGFIKELNRFGNGGRYLPVINLYMSCPKLKMKYIDEQMSFRLTISLKDFLKRWSFYAHGYEPWKIGAPQKYITNEIVNALNKCENTKDVSKYLYSKFSEIQGDGKELEKGKKAMIQKWVAAIDSIFRDQFTSNLFRHEDTTAPTWKLKTPIKEMTGHPFIVSLEAGLVPVINNYLAKSKPIAKKHMSDLLRKIVDHQMEMEEQQKRIWIFVDELKDFLGKKGDDLYQALDYIFTQGRYNKIGFVGNVQEYTKLSPSMQANSTHLIIFELQTDVERRAVAKDYQLDKDKLGEMASLKTFQCLFTTKEKMIIYNKEGKKREYKDGGLWRGKIIPPISCHKSP